MTPQQKLNRKSDTNKRSASNHGDLPKIQRHEIHPDILLRTPGGGNHISLENNGKKLTKLLIHVTVQRSLGPVHVLMSPENPVEDLIKTVLEKYVKEKRRPLLIETNPHCFELHFSQFSLESLNPKEKLINVGSRNFFLCSKSIGPVKSSCSDQAKKANNFPFTWPKLMDFLL